MSDIAIQVENVSRIFRRFQHPRHRALELFGLKPPKGSYNEFQALDDISFEVKHGERLALIGRNGAGKSTLLSIICGRLRQTSGKVRVNGSIQALMELGTGFHPEFTGRENVLASLAYQGVTGKRAMAMLDEIIDFAELEAFIDQQVKTYSAGMYARLAFSTSTAVEPDILIVDEVLGAGDAYFSAKSTDRMKRLTIESGATVLFVSHDISAVERLCERAIWVDKGKIRMDDTARSISKAYYASILEQEEQRLRNQTARLLQRQRQVHAIDGATIHVRFRLPAKAQLDHLIRKVSVEIAGQPPIALDVGKVGDEEVTNPAFLVNLATDPNAWGVPILHDSQRVRALNPSNGSSEAAICFNGLYGWREHPLKLEVQHCGLGSEHIHVDLVSGKEVFHLGNLSECVDTKTWLSDTLTWSLSDSHAKELEIHKDVETAVARAFEDSPQQKTDRWRTEVGSFVECMTYARDTSTEKLIFALGEDIVVRTKFALSQTVDEFWYAVIVFDNKGERVCFDVHHFEHGGSRGIHEVTSIIESPNLRHGDYAISIDVLPGFRFDWEKTTRMPFICHLDRGVHFKVNENYIGTIELGTTRQNIVTSLQSFSSAA
ncbi:ABC transporter ATP-binding protein [Bordetella sp. FB-8]|uniref:ABC transporter ATP-binding protein n=1 Tax=Bordetella sp. FB-8 TaxID=1159870 RepID=UPI000382856C|nr:ABC transporter ATP-binding protein [Bordetella sp. FB-8]